jgi:hypothetical protein
MRSEPVNFIDELTIPGCEEIDADRFARVTGVHLSELEGLSGNGGDANAIPLADVVRQGLLCDSIKALSAAYSIAQDREKTLRWFSDATIPEFQNMSVKCLVANGGIDAVVNYLSAIHSGSSG